MWMLIGIVGLLLSFATLILTIVGLIAPQTFQRVLKYVPTKKKIASRGILASLVFFIVGIVGAINDTPKQAELTAVPSQQPQATSNTEPDTKAEQDQTEQKLKEQNEIDLKKLVDFHKSLILSEKDCNNINKRWAAQKNADIYAMYDLAKEGERVCLSAKIPDVPQFNNKDLQTKVERVHEASSSALTSSWSVYDKLKDSLNEGKLSPETNNRIKQSIEFKNTSVMVAAASLIEAYSSLGISPEKIDSENGGIKK